MLIDSRQKFKDYCLRQLGEPVVKVNVADEQVEDRIDEAILYFRDYHYDGVQKYYLKHQVTQDDINNGYIATDPLVYGVTKVYNVGLVNTANNNLFSAQYMIVANDILSASNGSMINFDMSMSNLALLDFELNGHKLFRFNRLQNKIFLDTDWQSKFPVDTWILIECYVALDPDVDTKMWNDPFLKKYATALIKRQWGANGKKFGGVALPGGTAINFQAMYDEAVGEIKDLEEEMIEKSAPLEMFIG